MKKNSAKCATFRCYRDDSFGCDSYFVSICFSKNTKIRRIEINLGESPIFEKKKIYIS